MANLTHPQSFGTSFRPITLPGLATHRQVHLLLFFLVIPPPALLVDLVANPLFKRGAYYNLRSPPFVLFDQ